MTPSPLGGLWLREILRRLSSLGLARRVGYDILKGKGREGKEPTLCLKSTHRLHPIL